MNRLPPETTLCHGTESDTETLLGRRGSRIAGFPRGVCALPTEFPMTVHFVRAWKHDGSWGQRHNACDKAHREKMVQWSTAFSPPCLRLHIIYALLKHSFFHNLWLERFTLQPIFTPQFPSKFFFKQFYWQDRWRAGLLKSIQLGFWVRKMWDVPVLFSSSNLMLSLSPFLHLVLQVLVFGFGFTLLWQSKEHFFPSTNIQHNDNLRQRHWHLKVRT